MGVNNFFFRIYKFAPHYHEIRNKRCPQNVLRHCEFHEISVVRTVLESVDAFYPYFRYSFFSFKFCIRDLHAVRLSICDRYEK